MLYTKKGDNGTTGTFGCDQRMSKSSAIAEALGALDETNSYLGLCKIKAKKYDFILSRELSFDEIEAVRQDCPDMEIEVFVHGALCIAYSGRCLLSGYMSHRDSNQGACTNSCRWDYKLHPAKEEQNRTLK